MLTEELKRDVIQSILHPVRCAPELREQVQTFLYDKFGIPSYDHYWPVEWGLGYRWLFCFDANGLLVPLPTQAKSPEASLGHTMLSISVSRRGPYVTAHSYADRSEESGCRAHDWVVERSAGRRAVDLAQEVAHRFGLTYLDAAELCAWELDESVADAADVDVQDAGWDVPNAFILLFG